MGMKSKAPMKLEAYVAGEKVGEFEFPKVHRTKAKWLTHSTEFDIAKPGTHLVKLLFPIDKK